MKIFFEVYYNSYVKLVKQVTNSDYVKRCVERGYRKKNPIPISNFTQIQIMTPSIINQRRLYTFCTVKLRILQPQVKHDSLFLINS